jgi:predicted alpha/beta-hydrolase family hydrolase
MEDMMKSRILVILILILNHLLFTLDYQLEYPKLLQEKSACLIICPGSGYHKDLPLIRDLAKYGIENDISVLRFNWPYFTEKRKPSDKYQEELESIDAMIRLAKNDPRIDSTRIYLAGKSLGSVLAYRAMINKNISSDSTDIFRKEIKALILLTPIFPNVETAEQYHPHFKKFNQDCLIVVGKNDHDNCDIKALSSIIDSFENKIDVIISGGDHSFNLEAYQEGVNSEINNRQVDFISQQVIDWINNKNE